MMMKEKAKSRKTNQLDKKSCQPAISYLNLGVG